MSMRPMMCTKFAMNKLRLQQLTIIYSYFLPTHACYSGMDRISNLVKGTSQCVVVLL